MTRATCTRCGSGKGVVGLLCPPQKGRYGLLPTRALRAVAGALTTGAATHGDHGWNDEPFGALYDALQRHAQAWWEGESFDPDGGQHHLAAVAARALMLLELDMLGRPDQDDRPTHLLTEDR